MSNHLIRDSETKSVVNGATPVTGEIARIRTPLGRFAASVVLLIAVFSKTLAALAVDVANSDLHSYILLVPFVSAYLIYTRRSQLPKRYAFSPGFALVLVGIGLAALAVSWMEPSLSRNDHLTLTTLSFVCVLAGAGFLFLGRKWMYAAAFPIGLLIFIVPMPDAMVNALETASKLASTEAADLFFNVTGTPILRDGVVFQLPNITVEVGQECSGIRSSWILMITSLLAANLFLETTWRRALLVTFVIPLGILRNGFRIWAIGTLCIRFGPQMIYSIIHRRGGPFFFALSLIPLFFLLWWLRRGEAKAQKSEVSGPDSVSGVQN